MRGGMQQALGEAQHVRANLEKQCEEWNAQNAVGVPVHYRDDTGKMIETATRGEAYVLSGHTAVIFVDKFSGCVKLDRVTVRP